MATREREKLSKDTFLELVQDRGGWSGFMYALYQKLISLGEQLDELARRVGLLEGGELTPATVDAWVREAAQDDPLEEEDPEQMLGERSPYGWHLLHPGCWSWDEVRRLREKIVSDVKAQGIFQTSGDLTSNSVESSVHRGKAFESYRRWVWSETGEPEARPAVAGLDPWSYLPGLRELAGEADDRKYRNRFIEIHLGGSR